MGLCCTNSTARDRSSNSLHRGCHTSNRLENGFSNNALVGNKNKEYNIPLARVVLGSPDFAAETVESAGMVSSTSSESAGFYGWKYSNRDISPFTSLVSAAGTP